MTWASRIFIIILIIFSFTSIPYAQNNPDRWFSKDKYQHFAISAFYTAGIAKVAHRHFEQSRDRSVFIAAGITISLGAIKEGLDHQLRKGNSSYKDFIWDITGTFVGALTARLAL